jgi:hypothetical protein
MSNHLKHIAVKNNYFYSGSTFGLVSTNNIHLALQHVENGFIFKEVACIQIQNGIFG